MQRTSTTVVGVVILAYGLLLSVWTAGTPPYQAPDEVGHVIRTYGLSRGQLLGPKASDQPPPPEIAGDPVAVARYEWALETTTFVQIPPHLNPRDRDCARDPLVSAACLDGDFLLRDAALPTPTNTGSTNPVGLALPAVLTRFGNDAGSAGSWARVGQVATTLVLLGLSVVALRPAGPTAVAGLVLAVTPMVQYLGAVVNPTGAEVWLAIACFAASWRMVQEKSSRRWAALAAIFALVLPLIRQPGAVWALLALASVVALGGRIRDLPRAALETWAVAWIAGVGLAYAWDTHTGVQTPVGLAGAGSAVGVVWDRLGDLLRQAVGEFNVLEYPLPDWATGLWLFVALTALVRAIAARGVRSLAPLVPLLGTLGFLYAFWLLTYRLTGFGLQGRHVLGGLVLVPLVALLARPVGPRLAGAVIAATTILNGVIVFLHLRRFGAGITSPLRFWPSASWDPVGGWEPWLLAGGLAVALLLAVAALIAGTAPAGIPPTDERVAA